MDSVVVMARAKNARRGGDMGGARFMAAGKTAGERLVERVASFMACGRKRGASLVGITPSLAPRRFALGGETLGSANPLAQRISRGGATRGLAPFVASAKH
jgi:hypothetical protein